MDILTSYEWHSYLPEYEVLYIYIYGENEINVSSYLFKHDFERQDIFKFYLSDEPDEEFDESKVGKAQNGKFIVYLNNDSRTTVDEIRSLSDEELVTKRLGRYVGGVIKPKRFVAKEKKGEAWVEEYQRGGSGL